VTGPAMEATGLRKSYARRGVTGAGRRTTALDGIDLCVRWGESWGIVGESGSGKSTLLRILLALDPPDTGEVRFDGTVITGRPERSLRPLRRRFQAVFQDAYASLDPRLSVRTIIAEPLMAHGLASGSGLDRQVRALLDAVGLPRAFEARRPATLSGGERQRVAIARALAPKPDLLLLDEPVSALDVSFRRQILDLLDELRHGLGLTTITISHDLETIGRLCTRVAVMYRGRIVESGPAGEVLARPLHPYTALLLSGQLVAAPGATLPVLLAPPGDGGPWPHGSCAFAPRCPKADPRCTEPPDLSPPDGTRRAACWHPLETLPATRAP